MRSRRLAALAVAVVMAVATALPASAAEGPKHKSCKALGVDAWAMLAKSGLAGEVISFNARNEVTAPWGVTYTPPGSIAAIVHDEMFLLGLCESPD